MRGLRDTNMGSRASVSSRVGATNAEEASNERGSLRGVRRQDSFSVAQKTENRMTPRKLPAAVSLGRRGGKAGTGKSQVRGTPEYYRALQAKSTAAKKRRKKENGR